MSKTIGIDLGTTNSAAGLKRLEVEIIPNAEGENLTPSVVGLQKNKGFFRKQEKFVVGKHALDWMAQDSENTILSIKRLMGRSFNDPEIERLIKEQHYAYKICPLKEGSVNSVAVMLGGKEYTPEQISSMIVKKIKEDCEKHLGEKVEYAVVTVPAYFNDKQKHATRVAAALAGLKVQRLLPEPTAAAISFGVDSIATDEAKTILVYDLGGGTFDISVLTVANGQFIEQGKGGDMWMGGDDVDSLIVNHIFERTETACEISDIPALIGSMPKDERNRFLGDLKRKVEQAKIQLSDKDSTVVEILGLLKDEDGDIVDIEVELSRQQFEAILAPFANRSVELINRVLQDIHFEPAMIEQVVMVGGSSSIPLLQRKVQELFGTEKVLIHPRPMLAITEGASILAHKLADQYECPKCGKDVDQAAQSCPHCGFDLAMDLSKRSVKDIVHSVSHDYYLELEDGSDHLLVEKNTPLPLATQGTFSLVHAEQRLAHFKFFNRVGDARESIGDLWLTIDDIPVAGNRPAEVTLDFKIDEDNIITVTAGLKGNADIKVGRTLSRGGPDERLFLDIEQGITKINSSQHEYWTTYDYLQWVTHVAKRINEMADSSTMDTAVIEQSRKQLQTAESLVEKNETIYPQIFFAENLVAQFGRFMPDNQRKDLDNSVKNLRAIAESGTAEEVLKAREAMRKQTDKQSQFLVFANIDNAIELQYKNNQAQAERLMRQREQLFKMLEKNDVEKFKTLLNEMMPEVYNIIENHSKQKLQIWKGVRKSG